MKEYRMLFDEIHASDRLRQEVQSMTRKEITDKRRKRLPKAALIAAVLVIALAGTTLAAVVGVPGTLRGWFDQRWQEKSDAPMPEEQAALIERLTQPVGASDTQNGVTVTLDSLTVGDSTLWLLLKVEGAFPLEEQEDAYYFGPKELMFMQEPDGNETPGGYGMGYSYVGVAEDGKLTMLLHYDITLTGEDSLLRGGEMTLLLQDLMYDDAVLAAGEWALQFTVEPVEDRQLLTLERAVVPANDHENGGKETVVEIRNIRVSETGIRFSVAAEDAMLYPRMEGVLLKDGTLWQTSGGGSRWLGEIGQGEWVSDYNWELPVELSQVEALQFSGALVPLQ